MSRRGARGRHADLALPGATFAARVTPGARHTDLSFDGTVFAIRVGAPPEGGRATEAARRALAAALGVAPGRLTLVRGASARDKAWRLD